MVLGSRVNTIMPEQSARSRITGQLGLNSCLSEFFFSLELLQVLLWTNGNGLKSKTNGEMLNFRQCFHTDSPFVARGKMFCCFQCVEQARHFPSQRDMWELASTSKIF